MKEQYNNNIERVKESNMNSAILELLEDVKDRIADARIGLWSTEARKLAIDSIDTLLYNKIKVTADNNKTPVKPEEWI